MERKCDGCTVCCTVLMVPELQKPMYEMCKFCDKGCTIYNERPQSCRDFECGWLKGEMSEDMKPDKAHFMVEHFPDNIPLVGVYPEKGYEDTWKTPEVEKNLKETYQDKGISIVTPGRVVLLAQGHTVESVREGVIKAKTLLGV